MDEQVISIWEKFHDKLKGYTLARLQDEDDANDLLQDVFIKISQNMDKIESAENSKFYLIAVVRNAVNDFFRKKVIYESDEIALEKPEETESTLNQIVADCCVRPFIEKLPEKYKEALLLSEIAGIPQKELAKQLNISYTGLKSRVQRGRVKLKEMILSCCQYESDKYGNLLNDSGSCDSC